MTIMDLMGVMGVMRVTNTSTQESLAKLILRKYFRVRSDSLVTHLSKTFEKTWRHTFLFRLLLRDPRKDQ